MNIDATDTGTFDYVIIGGGTAGCILADRLSADSRTTVAVIEAGGVGRSLWIGIPAGFGKLLTGSTYNWRFETEPEEGTRGRRIVVPRGKGLGGSSLINGMIYVRGQPADYDGWAQRGARGWGFDDVLPYFQKLEAYADPSASPERGRSGPMSIEPVHARNPVADAFIAAGVQAGFATNPDYNGRVQDGFGYYQATQRNGRRWSAASAYLEPALRRANLKVITEAHVMGVEGEDGRLSRVRYRRGAGDLVVTARREIVLAAGAVQSPQILELSGIGDPAVLGPLGIEVRHALSGIGANYQDHFATRMNWRVSQPVTLNEQARGWRLGLSVADYFLRRRGILTLGTGLAHGFVRTRPEIEGPDVQYFFMHASYANAADRRLDTAPGMTIGVTQLRPQSRGTIHAKSSDPFVAPAIRPNFLVDPVDQQTMVDGMKIARNIIAQPAMDPYRAYEMNPGESVQSDDQWLDFARANGQTIYHPVGTCRMGHGPDAVVDERLRLIGRDGLRVADASIMPTMVSANTQAAVMMIAEKAADMILADARAA